jgi:flagellar hook assembly protein FlgD
VKKVDVHDARGRLVATLPVEQGAAAATWNGRDDRGNIAPAGIYWARAVGERGTRVARIVKL